jgi:hypothetical protein
MSTVHNITLHNVTCYTSQKTPLLHYIANCYCCARNSVFIGIHTYIHTHTHTRHTVPLLSELLLETVLMFFPMSLRPIFIYVSTSNLHICLYIQSSYMSLHPIFIYVSTSNLPMSLHPIFIYVSTSNLHICLYIQSSYMSLHPIFLYVSTSTLHMCLYIHPSCMSLHPPFLSLYVSTSTRPHTVLLATICILF